MRTRPRPRLLDLYSSIGGAAVGYHRAGYDITGVDIQHQPDYPYRLIVADAITVLLDIGWRYDLIHASPPCQAEGALRSGTMSTTGHGRDHPRLITATREALEHVGRPYVIENVKGSGVRRDVMLCGETFGLGILGHRYFELGGWTTPQPPHPEHRGRVRGWRHGTYHWGPYVGVYGDGGGRAHPEEARAAKGIDWTWNRQGLRDALPPAYTEWLGRAAREQLGH